MFFPVHYPHKSLNTGRPIIQLKLKSIALTKDRTLQPTMLLLTLLLLFPVQLNVFHVFVKVTVIDGKPQNK